MNTERNGEPIVLCDFCSIDEHVAMIVDAGTVAICAECLSKCFMVLMGQVRTPTVEVKPDEK